MNFQSNLPASMPCELGPDDAGVRELSRTLHDLLARLGPTPAQPNRKLVRLPRVLELTASKKSHVYNMLNKDAVAYDPGFPRPFTLSKNPKRGPRVWWEDEILAWLESKAKANRAGDERRPVASVSCELCANSNVSGSAK